MFGIRRALRKRGGVSLTFTLATSISALLLVAVLSVLFIGLWSGAKNTQELLQQQAYMILSTTSEKVQTHLSPASNQVALLRQLIASGELDPARRDRLIDTFQGGLSAAPQLDSVLYFDHAYQGTGVGRSDTGFIKIMRDYSSDQKVRDGVAKGLSDGKGSWGDPIWLPLIQKTLLNYRAPVTFPNGKPGLLVASVTVSELSSYLGNFDPDIGSNVYILHDRDKVLAHPNLASLRGGNRNEDAPLPSLAETGDPVLAAFWQTEDRFPLEIATDSDLQGHVLSLFDDEYVFIYRDLPGFASKPWKVGTYFRSSEVDAEFRRLLWAALAGLATLLVALAGAIWLGRRIAQPVVDTAFAASRIGQLDISDTPKLKGSTFRELNDQAIAFNTMLEGLKWFETYVPKKLVRRLISQDGDKFPSSVERDVTVMFTDIVGYSGLSEGIAADQVAKLLNRHFGLLAGCIEAEDGTVDKFIGDSVMAFWGAPDHYADHADRAVRAAQAIERALDEDNKARAAAGEPEIKIRIGLHSGPVTVGNIGAPGRINYTIIGDNVNLAQRLEQLGKQFTADPSLKRSVTTLLTAATADQLTSKHDLDDLGDQTVRGRNGNIRVYRL
ncbi:MAG: adenylate/guanylate cyclase domain-containing protein [Anderseniella sp.]